MPYLLSRGLLSRHDVVVTGAQVAALPTRNSTLSVALGGVPCYLIKQAQANTDATVRHEARMHKVMKNSSARSRTGARVSTLAHYEEALGVLVLRVIPGHDLQVRASRAGGLSRTLAAALGRALAQLHKLPVDALRELRPPTVPAAFLLHEPRVGMLSELSDATLDLVRSLQAAPGCAAALARLAGAWRAPVGGAFCHNDVRWSNIILHARERRGQRPRVTLIDWELAGEADPAWDVGSVVGCLLTQWPRSIVVTGTTAPDSWAKLADVSIDDVQPAIRAFWTAYVGRIGSDRKAGLLGRAIRCAGARLVQDAFESTQMASELSPADLLTLQLGVNLLTLPQAAAAIHILGLPADAL